MPRFACPCCGYLTLDQEGLFNVCHVCGWEDDPDARRDAKARNANGVRLITAQANFVRFGAYRQEAIHRVRPPLPIEFPPDAAWPEARER